MCTHILGYNLTIWQGKHQIFLKIKLRYKLKQLAQSHEFDSVSAQSQSPSSSLQTLPLGKRCSNVMTQQFRKQSRKSGQDGTTEKPLGSPPLTSTPKLQLSAEQPSVTKTGPARKGLLQQKTQRRNQWERWERRIYSILKSHVTSGWLIHSWRIILQRFTHRGKPSETHVRLSSPGFWHWEDELPEHLAL